MPAQPRKFKDEEREVWINTDNALWAWWRGTALPQRAFIAQNREEIDTHINTVLMGRSKESKNGT